ncbi:MAG: glycosyltransferase family 2 protein [Acidobacteriota bacterium]|jgi:cellulose synthase/poly-beta-1,6-N-acetylglucosamine synthase-like glycosyltransferase
MIVIIAAIMLFPAALATAYYAILALVSLLPPRMQKTGPAPIAHRFAVLIPAHDEENTISKSVHSCLRMDYPLDKFDVYVIADNCSDRTAVVAQACGARCLVRTDASKKGKGYALEWGFQNLRSAGYDAFVVVDADCTLDSAALRAFDLELSLGAEALQASDGVSNADENAVSYALAVGNLVENRLFYEAKSRLGLPVFLRGTGMVLRTSLLERIPWNAHSVVEDLEYSLRLVAAGQHVRFLRHIEVRSAFPVTGRQLHVQRERWAKGNLGFGRRHAFRLMMDGVKQRSPGLLDAGWTLLVLSRPLVLAYLLGSVIGCFLIRRFAPGPHAGLLFAAALILLAINVLYFGLGVFLLGVTWPRLLLLMSIPLVVARLAWISMRGLTGAEALQWNRTPRSQ